MLAHLRYLGTGYLPAKWAPGATHLVNEVAYLIGIGRAWTVLWGRHEGWSNVIPGDFRAGIQASMQLAQIKILGREDARRLLGRGRKLQDFELSRIRGDSGRPAGRKPSSSTNNEQRSPFLPSFLRKNKMVLFGHFSFHRSTLQGFLSKTRLK